MSGSGTLVMPKTESVKVDADLLKKIKVILTAAEKKGKIGDWISDVIRPVVLREYPKALKKLYDAEQKEGTE